MKFDELVNYIRENGCAVRIYKNLSTIKNCDGFFDLNKKGQPVIYAAIKGLIPSQQMQLLSHEYGHYLQYLEDKDRPEEELDCYKLQEDWTARKLELTRQDWLEARNMMLVYEYDADVRAIKLAKELDLTPWNELDLIRSANAYNASMKWAWDTRQNFSVCAKRNHFKPTLKTEEEIIAPLTVEEWCKINKLIRVANR